eukprot:1509500-Prymnesium_polylepis.2
MSWPGHSCPRPPRRASPAPPSSDEATQTPRQVQRGTEATHHTAFDDQSESLRADAEPIAHVIHKPQRLHQVTIAVREHQDAWHIHSTLTALFLHTRLDCRSPGVVDVTIVGGDHRYTLNAEFLEAVERVDIPGQVLVVAGRRERAGHCKVPVPLRSVAAFRFG